MSDDIVKRLREGPKVRSPHDYNLMQEAANAIETLLKERAEAWRAERQSYEDAADLNDENDKLREARDAAIARAEKAEKTADAYHEKWLPLCLEREAFRSALKPAVEALEAVIENPFREGTQSDEELKTQARVVLADLKKLMGEG